MQTSWIRHTWPAAALAAALLAAAPSPGLATQAASPAPAADLRLEAPLPVDPAVRSGRLKNGLTYFLRHNERPDDRVALRLAVRAGSVYEEDSQRGLAHLLEHMVFNGSRNFPPGELVRFLESIGARFGADANAYTSFDETVYMLEVPTDRPFLVEKALLALGDFAGRASLTDAEIDKERGVVLEEWRLGQGAAERVRRRHLPVLYHGSRYAERLPIGDPEVLRRAPAERIREFYRTWYRPENMALVAVGDLDVAALEKLLQRRLGDLKGKGDPRPAPAVPVPAHTETLVSVAPDPEASSSTVSVVYKHPAGAQATVADYRRFIVENLFHLMMNARLEEIARRTGAPFLAASSASGTLARGYDSYNLAARSNEGGVAAGLRALLTEARRVSLHGFTPGELERAKRTLLAGYERSWRERDKSESGSYAREYVSHFLEGEPIPGIATEYEYAKAFLPGIGLADVQGLARSFIHEGDRVVLATVPEQEAQAASAPTPESLSAVVREVATAEVSPWQDTATGRALMEQLPEPGRVLSSRELPDLGVTVLRLSNGVEAWLKPTDFKNDQVLFLGSAEGGASLAAPEHAFDALLATSFVAEAGFGGFSPTELEKVLAGRLVSVSPFIRRYTHGVSGSSSPGDLEAALQLVHLEMTRPEERAEAFEVFRKRLAGAVLNRLRDPNTVYRDRITELNSQGHPLYRPLTAEAVEKLDPARGLTFYRERFANAADFTFFFVGAFDVETITPLVARYLGSLPSTGERRSKLRDPGLQFPPGTPRARVEQGREPKALVTLSFFADTGLSPLEVQRAEFAAAVLRTRLRGLLREERSQTYGVSVGYDDENPLRGFGLMTVSFGAAPGNVETMVAAVLEEISRLQDSGPNPDEIRSEHEIERRELEVALRQNGYWLASLARAQLLGWPPESVLEERARIDAIDRTALRDAFRRYFPRDRHTVVTLVPAGTSK